MDVEMDREVITVAPVMVESDAMDVGVEGWYRLGGEWISPLISPCGTSNRATGELGAMEEDGLGHRFFLSVGGTLAEPEFGYDRAAHKNTVKEATARGMEPAEGGVERRIPRGASGERHA